MADTSELATYPRQSGSGERNRENLAHVLQEAITAVVRIQANRQPVTDAALFREQFLEALKAADRDARKQGYTGDDSRMGIFAVVAFLDEAILNSRNPVLEDWTKQPLQVQLFGDQVAGETFFNHLRSLLGRQDSQHLADVLEVFELCMLMGFKGRYTVGRQGELGQIIQTTGERIRRIRGGSTALSPAWAPPADAVRRQGDTWVRRLIYTTAGTFGFALVLWLVYYLVLRSGAADLAEMAARST